MTENDKATCLTLWNQCEKSMREIAKEIHKSQETIRDFLISVGIDRDAIIQHSKKIRAKQHNKSAERKERAIARRQMAELKQTAGYQMCQRLHHIPVDLERHGNTICRISDVMKYYNSIDDKKSICKEVGVNPNISEEEFALVLVEYINEKFDFSRHDYQVSRTLEYMSGTVPCWLIERV